MFSAGERVFLPGAAGQPSAVLNQLFASDAEIWTSFVPGINRIDATALSAGTHVIGLFAHSNLMRRNPVQFSHLPVSYGGFLRLLRTSLRFDTAIIQVSPPDTDGRCSLGPLAEFSPLVVACARRTIAVINDRTPFLPRAATLPIGSFAHVVETSTPLLTYDVAVDDNARAIAAAVAQFIGDGAAIQIGLGKVPQALAEQLTGRRGLRFHSGMLSDGIMALATAGAIDPDWPHRTTALLGSASLYEWARDRTDIHIVGCEMIHDPAILMAIEGLVAVNSALEVDLMGQCNLEIAAGLPVSGPGGAPDFARAAAQSSTGCSIVALPACAKDRSRIVSSLSGGIASLGRADVDVVVTEYGAADLRGKTMQERATALIGIAAPFAREQLERASRAGTA